MRARPSEDGIGLDKTPFTVRKEPRHPLYTFDCCWFCGVDILRAESKRAVGKTTIPYRDCVRDAETNLDATAYELNEKTPEGAHLRGHMAIADYHGEWVVWAGDDIDCETLQAVHMLKKLYALFEGQRNAHLLQRNTFGTNHLAKPRHIIAN